MADGQERERRIISEHDAKIVFETSEEVSVTPTFDSMKIREDLLRGIYAYGKRKKGLKFSNKLGRQLTLLGGNNRTPKT